MDDNIKAYSVLVSMDDKDKMDEFLKMAFFWVEDNCDDDSWAISMVKLIMMPSKHDWTGR